MRSINYRTWTATEDEFLRLNYRKSGAKSCGQKLNRCLKSVYQRARDIGLSETKNFATTRQIEELIKEKHPLGYCDSEIARIGAVELNVDGIDRHRVGEIRRRLKLESNKLSDRRRNQVAEKTREQLRQSGHPNLASLRGETFSKFKASLGWPDELTIRAVQALELFYRHGTLTRIQLCELMGVSSKKRTAPISNGPGGTVLAELQRAGMIQRIPKGLKTKRRDRRGGIVTCDVYFLSPGVKPDESKRTFSFAG